MLEAMGFSPSGDFYLGFEIANFSPVMDASAIDPTGKGKYRYQPYFTTLQKLLIHNE
ncbi:MAG: hypothetical protein J6C44_10200 [Muribaculaceae bacterium]|nr:hypothetical protein [Muribaculaceae bacterium]